MVENFLIEVFVTKVIETNFWRANGGLIADINLSKKVFLICTYDVV